ncbi:MAG: hypothetical protein GY765_43555 [bacterium]|nr:hypothetical protein [bacterium]
MKKGVTLFFIVIAFAVAVLLTSCKVKDDGTDPNPTPQPDPCETRGTWIWASSIDSASKRTTVLQKIASCNLNTVLVSIPPLNGNFGHGAEDNFTAFISAAKNQGLSVHAWMENAARRGSKRVLLKGRIRKQAVEIDFREETEQEAQVQWVMDIMARWSSNLDGVHLDYIRYLHSENINIGGKMDAVTATITKIHDNLASAYPGTRLTATCFREVPANEESYKDPPEWPQDVPQWFKDWYAANPGSIYHGPQTVAVPSFMRYQQDPITWIRNGIVDAVLPMQYTVYDDDWIRSADLMKSFNISVGNDPTDVIMGLGWLPKPFPTSQKGFDAPGVARKIKYGRSIDLTGFCIFILANHSEDDTPLINILSTDSTDNDNDAPFEKTATTCLD